MQGDFTRWTYRPTRDYRSVLMQQGRVLLDAEWNEQAAITTHHDEVRTSDVVGRAGGPLPASGPGGFAIVDGTTGSDPSGTAWGDLVITSGRYYVDGVLAESWPPPTAEGEAPPLGWPLADQPHLASIGDGADLVPGLAEPADDGRYVAYLDIWSHHVTYDEDPELLEPALGGPDTATREQTVWQIKLDAIDDDEHCSTMSGADWNSRLPRRLTAALRPPEENTDPCEISAVGGYQRLENQLYRVQVHDAGTGVGGTTFLWSRENASVTAGLDDIHDTIEPDLDDALVIDRTGRDDELSIGQDDLIEVTSADRQLQGLKGYLARVGKADGLTLHVEWLDTGPGSVAALGEAPIVRRWEAGPIAPQSEGDDLEGGIFVSFSDDGQAATGDYWLIPARTVRLAYGVNALSGTIEWPVDEAGDPVSQPPLGPVHHLSPLAILVRAAGTWDLESDCRHLFPPLTDLVTIDLIGGDGQEAMPGDWLDEPVRVVVRNGGQPVGGAGVLFSALGGDLSQDDPPTPAGNPLPIITDDDGVAFARWRLDPTGTETQTLSIRRTNDVGDLIDVEVIATARLSVARELAWTPACDGFADATTVQAALDQLVLTRDLRLLGGDGQQVWTNGDTVPHPIRVLLDSPCGPVSGVEVTAIDAADGLVAHDDGQPVPATLEGTGAVEKVAVTTDDAGVASFVWQPGFGTQMSAALDIFVEGSDEAPIRVTAQINPPGSKTPGVHITRLRFATQPEELFHNDSPVSVDLLTRGIMVELDGPVVQDSVRGKPVVRVVLDLPWPVITDGEFWSDTPIGYRRVELAGQANADGPLIVWSPTEPTVDWLLGQFPASLLKLEWNRAIRARFVIDGWAIVSEDDPRLHLNGHADARVKGLSPTRYALPTDDEIAGGVFDSWFWLSEKGDMGPDGPLDQREFVTLPNLVGMPREAAEAEIARRGLALGQVGFQIVFNQPLGIVTATDPVAGTRVELGTPVGITVSTRIVLPVPQPEPVPLPGPVIGVVVLPDLTNMTRARAERLLDEHGLTLDEVVEDSSPGIRRNTVLATDPPAGTEIQPGTPVVLRVSRGING